MFTKRYGKQLMATCYVWKGNAIINEDRFGVAALNSYSVSRSCWTNVKTWITYIYTVVAVHYIIDVRNSGVSVKRGFTVSERQLLSLS